MCMHIGSLYDIRMLIILKGNFLSLYYQNTMTDVMGAFFSIYHKWHEIDSLIIKLYDIIKKFMLGNDLQREMIHVIN